MIEIKFIGRGGQGAVVAAQILAKAFFLGGFYPQCYSLFGGERRGAPVKSFLRVDSNRILLKCEIKRADHLIIMAKDLLLEEPITANVKDGGIVLINSSAPVELKKDIKVAYIDAQRIARECGLGPIINTAMLGAYAKINPDLKIEELERAVREYVPAKVEENVTALRRAYEETSPV
ncbi:MAG: 2-oxoacid:acceptor oxidoreductase family protein [Desulfobacterota bacterium]|nr:2-oxoacid:acceptor oxidoreductase family protein [Thermodesulfobacteriota bacterium]MDW8001952.1 2-oxoacid:acceptor oxidoreductase family protein [Deltaproteobacteria bacterium]